MAHPGGRPTKYNPEVHLPLAEGFACMGLTREQIAERLGVNRSTLWRWEEEYPEFCNAVKEGMAMKDELIEGSLYQRAMGYSHKAVKIFMPAGAQEPVTVEYMEHYPPDTGAAIFLLKNKKPDKYRDKREYTVTDVNALNVIFQKSGDLEAENLETNVDKPD